MIGNIQLKVCGLTSAADARAAARAGADYLGFILWPKSPRFLALEAWKKLAPDLPAGPKRVAVMVEPGVAELSSAVAAGFDFVQIHFSHTVPLAVAAEWSEFTGRSRLWLAPKLPPEMDVAAAWLPLADTFLLDTFHAGGFGGSGRTGDWAKFARHRAAHSEKTWILAGGLTPENVAAALAASGARFVDVNSGVESSPGVKNAEKLSRFAKNVGA
ncbi:phosphoribosylanthranilate isomerase [Termitidicoccus mucosus]|uniref:N-(5'-phosphoribosyl)anthranilate isomerase n=1 Tax=Termitidicoccus mucosus TaxID=1184151 RepID=A0A178IAT7_9BACT|nr:phosphoribosylanthranilate isomerase [Opitutaceae bacterium TSB47]